jgi:SAM-dependent methyltransferase
MQFSNDEHKSIMNLIKQYKKNVNTELECRLFNSNKKNANITNAIASASGSASGSYISFDKFNNIMNHLIFSKEMGGLGLSYIEDTSLVVSMDGEQLSKQRLIISGKDNVKLFWLNKSLPESFPNGKHKVGDARSPTESKKQSGIPEGQSQVQYQSKQRSDCVDIADYGCRICLSYEDIMSADEITAFQKSIAEEKQTFTYRLKNRFQITADEIIRFDITSVKSATGTSMRNSGVLKSAEKYEVEIEVVDRKATEERIAESFLNHIAILLKLFQNSSAIIGATEKKTVLDAYKTLIGELVFAAVNPITLGITNLIKDTPINILTNYAVAPKADGERMLLYVHTDGQIYLIDGSLGVMKTGNTDTQQSWNSSIFEGEYIAESNLFLVYDTLFANGKDMREEGLVNGRLIALSKFVKSVKTEGFQIEEKIYKIPTDQLTIYDACKEIWDSKSTFRYAVDGLIFTPTKAPYPKRAGTWTALFKWKPEEFNSIDFLVRVEKDERGVDIRMPYQLASTNQMIQYKILTLFVGRTEGGIYKPVEFNPAGMTADMAKYVNRANIPVDENNRMFATDLFTKKKTEIFDNTIVEFVYNKRVNKKFAWTPIRVRTDKTSRYHAGEPLYGNNERVANDIWNNIQKPVSEDMIMNGIVPEYFDEQEAKTESESYYGCMEYEPNKRIPMQNFHNLVVKADLIKDVAMGTQTLLDLACGKGGDLSKWTGAGILQVVSIDISKPCIDYARDYYEKFTPKKGQTKPKVVYTWGDSSNLMFPNYDIALSKDSRRILTENVPSKYMFDTVSCQFCLHYFFENEDKLRRLLQNVADNLKDGGHFIGTCFDGARVDEMFKVRKSKVVNGSIGDRPVWSMERLYTTAKKGMFDRAVDVLVKSIGEKHKEYLVNFETLEAIAAEYNLKKVRVEEFGKLYEKAGGDGNEMIKMSSAEKEFSFLNNIFVFQKTGVASVKTIKKIRVKKTEKTVEEK